MNPVNYDNLNDLESIIAEIECDIPIDNTKLDSEALHIPKLYNKYLTYHSHATRLLHRKTIALKRVRKWWFDYYNKALPASVYVEKPLHLEIPKTERERYIEMKGDVVEAGIELEDMKVIVKHLEKTLDMIKSRTFQIKDAIAWKRFQAGD